MTDKYSNYRSAALAGGASPIDVDREIVRMQAEDARIQMGVCPRCGSKISRTLDGRQDGPTKIAG
jgi:hypothetical protein